MRIPVLAAVLATAASLCSAVPANAAAVWEPCDPAPLQCTSVAVPLDHARPHGAQVSLRVSRLPAGRPADRRGTLVLIPSGPGNTGVARPVTLNLPPEVRDVYDVVSFDPRGLGGSTLASCELSLADLGGLNPWPAPDGGISANVATARRVAAACAGNGGDLVRSISSRTEVDDLDRIRAALGERRISYWGISYGAYVGAAYATRYPGRTDRVVLDSLGDPDPDRLARGWLANTAVGAEDRFADFARWAVAQGMAPDAAAARELFLSAAARLDRSPREWVTGNTLREALRGLNTDAGLPRLGQLVRVASGGPLPAPPQPPPAAALQNLAAVATATICNDVAWPRPVEDYRRGVADNRARYPLTAGMPANITPCAFWPYPPHQPIRITDRGPSNVLLVQNLRDQATPYAGALRMREALGRRAVLVSVDAGGHGSYRSSGNACGDAAVTRYLLTGTRPATDVLCR
ncbi:alpha/beta hydrolase [Amycolatopsis suaedae]|uniref:Alpha/beta hydrolase n=1 Tax=Amycolatopsis suaedae TaxID=2510978 RepID=A0A4Q7IZU3_9PSEU|nr:alpha/beta hydrolase [Amycolatopsis suaedae]RZQ60581.1 alpha/beta hydrolase [Amycolatopsis suaedae]